MPAAYVKPYVRRQKNDAADAAGICEAVTRPSMRFINVRTLANQAVLMHHKTREMLVAQRTQLINALRGHLAEIGVIAAQGLKNARELARLIEMEEDATIPACVRMALAPLVRQLHALDQEIACSDRTIAAMARDQETARRLMTIPGLGPVTASAMGSSVQDISAFSGPRAFAAFLGLTPRQTSSGGKERLGRVSKRGNRYLRRLLVAWVPMRSSIIVSRTKTHCGHGRRSSCRPSPSSLLLSRSPIKWRGSPSRSCAARQAIAHPQHSNRRHRQKRPRATNESRVTTR
jgi:transposase